MISAACVQLICLPTARKLPLESSLPAPMPGSDTVPTQSPFRLEKHLSYPRSCWTGHFTCYKHRTDHMLATQVHPLVAACQIRGYNDAGSELRGGGVMSQPLVCGSNKCKYFWTLASTLMLVLAGLSLIHI